MDHRPSTRPSTLTSSHTPRERRRRGAALGLAAVTATAMLAATPVLGAATADAAPAAASSRSSVEPRVTPPALFRAAASAAPPAEPASVLGEHELVTLDASSLPATAGEQLRLPSADGGESVVDVTAVETGSDHTTWTGTLQGEPLSSFTLARVGTTLRGSLISPEGTFALTPAADGHYWWSQADPAGGVTVDDSRVVGESDAAAGAAGAASPLLARARAKKGKAKIGLLFGFTKKAQKEVGGKASLKAAARLVVSQTNETLRNSKVKAKVKYRGLVKVKGEGSSDPIKNAFRVAKARDGFYDNLQRVRKRKGADLIHLITVGSPLGTCGGGLIPFLPRTASPYAGASSSFVSCLPYLVATHEIGHNLGADHDKFPGVTHVAKTKGSFGYANPAGSYVTVMSYYQACINVGNYGCVRIPYFSSPKNTFNGQPLGSGKKTNNTKVVKQFVGRVARYVR